MKKNQKEALEVQVENINKIYVYNRGNIYFK